MTVLVQCNVCQKTEAVTLRHRWEPRAEGWIGTPPATHGPPAAGVRLCSERCARIFVDGDLRFALVAGDGEIHVGVWLPPDPENPLPDGKAWIAIGEWPAVCRLRDGYVDVRDPSIKLCVERPSLARYKKAVGR